LRLRFSTSQIRSARLSPRADAEALLGCAAILFYHRTDNYLKLQDYLIVKEYNGARIGRDREAQRVWITAGKTSSEVMPLHAK